MINVEYGMMMSGSLILLGHLLVLNMKVCCSFTTSQIFSAVLMKVYKGLH